MLRIFVLIIIFFLIFRFVLRLLRGPLKAFSKVVFSTHEAPKSVGGDNRVIDEMRPCAECGTFAPSRHAYRKNGLYFCNRQCHEAYLIRQRV